MLFGVVAAELVSSCEQFLVLTYMYSLFQLLKRIYHDTSYSHSVTWQYWLTSNASGLMSHFSCMLTLSSPVSQSVTATGRDYSGKIYHHYYYTPGSKEIPG